MKNGLNQRIVIRYSDAFKLKVIDEIERGKLTISEARKVYDIHGGPTIQLWIKKFGKLQLLNKVVRVEMKDEVSKLKQLEKEKKALESALAQAHLKILAYESLIEVAEEKLGIDLKKNLGEKPYDMQKKKGLDKMPE
jgi:transposase-like protein